MLGETVGSYRITSKLGEGGMGVVYNAEHTVMSSRAVVKVLRAEHALSDEMAQRFINEATAAATIRHPGIVQVMDVGRMHNGVLYILMEYLDGESLGSRIKRRGKLNLDDAVAIVQQAARALDAAHAKNIVHRDLKPDNLFLIPDAEVPGGERVKVLDFGIAKLSKDDAEPMAMTKSGAMMGTPLYMSPEQCRGAGEVDHRTDLYALGCILFEMLGGRPPYLGKGVGDLIASHLKDPVPSVLEHNPNVPREFDDIIKTLLAKEPSERFASAGALNGALQQAMSLHSTLDGDLPTRAETSDTLPIGSEAFAATHLSQPGRSTTTPDRKTALPTTTLGSSAAQVDKTADAPPPNQAKSWLLPALAVVAIVGGVGIFAATRGGGNDSKPAPKTVTNPPTNPPTTPATTPTATDAATKRVPTKAEACRNHRDGAACMAVAAEATADEAKTEYLKLACKAKHGPGCVALGERLEGKQTERDLAVAVRYYEKACRAKTYEACERVRYVYPLAHKKKLPHLAQLTLAQLACDGDARFCDVVAFVRLEAANGKSSTLVAQERGKAFELYRRACDAKNLDACVRLGSMYSMGHGVKANGTRASKLFYDACNAGEASGCLQLAYLWEDGRGVTKDLAKAKELYETSARFVKPKCERALKTFASRGVRDWAGMSACSTWAYHIDAGHGVKADKTKAKQLMARLCKMGRSQSCM